MKKFLSASIFVFIFSALSFSAGPSVWSVNSRTDVMKGDARGVSIDPEGIVGGLAKTCGVKKNRTREDLAAAASAIFAAALSRSCKGVSSARQGEKIHAHRVGGVQSEPAVRGRPRRDW